MGGNARWTAAAIRMDGGGKITMDSSSGDGQGQRNGRRNGNGDSKIAMGNSSGDGQQWHNGLWNSEAIMVGDVMAMATTATMTEKLAAVAATTMTMTADVVGRIIHHRMRKGR
jgi:hypothetical protein